MWWAMRTASPWSLPSGSSVARLISAGTNSTMPSALKTRAWCVIPRFRIRACTEPTAPDRARSAASVARSRARSAAPAARSRARARRRRAPAEAFASVRSPGPAAAMRRPPSSGAGVSLQIISSGITGIPPCGASRRIPLPGGVAGPVSGPAFIRCGRCLSRRSGRTLLSHTTRTSPARLQITGRPGTEAGSRRTGT
jgi:hypothetical protein